MLCRVYQEVKIMTLPEKKKKPKENQKRKKKGKNIIDSGNVLGWTQTVSKGTDVETLHKLLHICISFNGFNVHVS